MGLFSGISKTLFGGSDSSGVGRSGYSLLPKDIQAFYQNFSNQAQKYALPDSAGVIDSFTPLDVTGDEQSALDLIRKGLAPTKESLAADISMFSNPFDEYVINDINREAQSQNSVFKSAMQGTGQFNSNRGILGANDIEQNRLNQIGKFRQDQYNTSIDNILGPLADLRSADITNLFGAGDFERNLDTLKKQVPLEALKSAAALLGILPESGGSTNVSKSSSSNGLSSFF